MPFFGGLVRFLGNLEPRKRAKDQKGRTGLATTLASGFRVWTLVRGDEDFGLFGSVQSLGFESFRVQGLGLRARRTKSEESS